MSRWPQPWASPASWSARLPCPGTLRASVLSRGEADRASLPGRTQTPTASPAPQPDRLTGSPLPFGWVQLPPVLVCAGQVHRHLWHVTAPGGVGIQPVMRGSYVHPPRNIEGASGNHPNEKTAWMGLEGWRWRLKGLQLQNKKKRGPMQFRLLL